MTRPGRPGRPRPCRCRARGCEVATTHGRSPRLSASSVSAALLAADAAVMRPRDLDLGATARPRLRHLLRRYRGGGELAVPPFRGDLVEPAVSRSASRRELANTMVLWCASIRSTMRSSTAGQMLSRGSAPAAEPACSPVGCPSSVMSSTGTTTLDLDGLRAGAAATTVTGCWPPRNRATSSTGRTVADSPIRCAGRSSRASSRSRLSARWAPRLRAGDGVDLVDDHGLDAAAATRAPGWSGAGTATPGW